MLEAESKVAELQKQQQQQQQHRHLYQHQQSTGSIPGFSHQQNSRQNESPPLQPLRHESPVMNRPPGTGNSGGGGGGAGSSLMAGLRGFSNDLVQPADSCVAANPGLGNHMNSASPAGPRVKQPPPGFDPLSMLNSGTSNGQQSSQRNLLSPDMGLLNLETVSQVINAENGWHLMKDLGGSSGGQSRHDSGGPGNGFGQSHSGGGLLSNHHLHNGIQQGGGGNQQNQSLGLGLKNPNQENSSMHGGGRQPFLLEKSQQQQNPHQNDLSKDWQDGLRALLPNVNVSFGALPHHGPPQNGSGGPGDQGQVQPGPGGHAPGGQQHRMYSQQSSMLNHDQHQQQQHQHQQSHSGWNSVKSPHANDWTTLNPA